MRRLRNNVYDLLSDNDYAFYFKVVLAYTFAALTFLYPSSATAALIPGIKDSVTLSWIVTAAITLVTPIILVLIPLTVFTTVSGVYRCLQLCGNQVGYQEI
jgi:hypothetical protein